MTRSPPTATRDSPLPLRRHLQAAASRRHRATGRFFSAPAARVVPWRAQPWWCLPCTRGLNTGGQEARERGPAHARASRLATQNRGRRARHGPSRAPRVEIYSAPPREFPLPPSLGGNIPLPGPPPPPAQPSAPTTLPAASPLFSPATASPPCVCYCPVLPCLRDQLGWAWLARRPLSEFGFSSRIWASGARRPTGQVLFDLNVLEDKKTSIIKLQKSSPN